MAYFYIKSGGTATGDAGRYATKQTGTFAALGAANYYGTLAAAMAATTAPASGDFVLVSDAHNESASGSKTFNSVQGATALPITYISVDDSNIDQAKAATSVQITATGGDILLGDQGESRLALFGLYLKSDDDIRTAFTRTTVCAHECTLETTAGGDKSLYIGIADGCYGEFFNCTVIGNSSSSALLTVERGGTLKMFGGSVTGDQSNINALVNNVGFGAGGGTLELVGVDLSYVGGTSSYLIRITGGPSDDTMSVRFVRCRLASDLTGFSDEALAGKNKKIEAYNCSGSSSAAEYQFYIDFDQHTAEDDTTFYRDDSTAFTDGSQKVSIKVVTAAHAGRLIPFWFDLPATFAELSVATTDTIRIYLLSSDSGLTDNDVWADLIYPDGTNKHIANLLSAANTDPLAAGTALTANTDAWTGRTTETRYQIDLDTSGDTGADCAPIIRIYVGKPSVTVYFDTSVGVVA